MTVHHDRPGRQADALERIAAAVERIAKVVDEWAEANRTPQIAHQDHLRYHDEELHAGIGR